MVINYDVPNDAEDYVHRIGRTARAKTTGIGLTLINEDDMYKFQAIERLIEREIEKKDIPEEIGKSPEWNPRPVRRGRGGGGGGNRKGGNRGGGNRGGGNRSNRSGGGGGNRRKGKGQFRGKKKQGGGGNRRGGGGAPSNSNQS